MIKDNFKKKVLSNGMTLLHEYRKLPVVSVSITNKFGAGYETSDIKGIAHFIEHLVFTGTKTRSHEDISREIEKRGGVLNAFTSHEITSFWFKLPAEHLFLGLDILTDILNNPSFDKEKFEKEKKVILEEIKMYHDSPAHHVYEQIEKNLYDKPFGELVIGSAETVSALSRDFVAEYFKKVYAPENYIVSVVGNADFEELARYFETNFSGQKREITMPPIQLKSGHSVEERAGIDQAHLVFALHAPLPGEKDFAAMQVLDAYLANGMSSKLFLEIREKRGLAYSVRSSIECEKNYSTYSIYVGTTKEAVEEVTKLILEGFEKVSEMTEKDLEEEKKRLIGLKKVTSEESVNVMTSLILSEIAGKAEDYYGFEKRINAVTLDQVKKLSKIGEYSTAAIVPK